MPLLAPLAAALYGLGLRLRRGSAGTRPSVQLRSRAVVLLPAWLPCAVWTGSAAPWSGSSGLATGSAALALLRVAVVVGFVLLGVVPRDLPRARALLEAAAACGCAAPASS